MREQPASTASKAPASTTASKAPKPAAEPKAKKTAGKTSSSGADGEKKKRKKARKETYSSYIYKGEVHRRSPTWMFGLTWGRSVEAGPP